MPGLRPTWLALAALAIAPATASAQNAAQVLNYYRPSVAGVEYDTPETDADKAACKLELVKGSDGKANIGYAIRDPQGRLLRRIVDTDPSKVTKRPTEEKPSTHVDRWSYYRDGFEVYRENDLDEDGVLDEVRWLNAGGSRVGEIAIVPDSSGKKLPRVVAWKRISAEEASKVLVQALTAPELDLSLLETVMATPEDARALGLPAAAFERVSAAAAARQSLASELQKGLKGWGAGTNWARFDGTMPRVIPADASPDLARDLTLYENAVVMVNPADPQADPLALSYLHVPELVQVGETWKFLELPRAVDPTSGAIDLAQAGLRSLIYDTASDVPAGSVDGNDVGIPPEIVADLDALQGSYPDPSDGEATARWHLDRVEVLRKAIARAGTDSQKQNIYKLIIHDIAEAYRTGLYPQAVKVFDDFIAQGGKVGSFAAQRKVLADFDIAINKPGADFQDAQEQMVAGLQDFLANYDGSEEVPEVLLQLATVYEFNGAEDKAKDYWSKLASEYAATEPGKKAPGALRRLDLDGKPLVVSGPALDGKPASTADFAGKTVLVHYWMSLTEQDRREIDELKKVYAKFHDKGFEVVSVNLDPSRETAEEYLRANSLPWPVIYEEGGLDGRLAEELGIISTPSMVLIDEAGNVVSHKVRSASEVEKFLEKPIASRPVGLNLR